MRQIQLLVSLAGTLSLLIFPGTPCAAIGADSLDDIVSDIDLQLRREVSLADWRKLKSQGDAEYKAEHYQEAIKFYKEAGQKLNHLSDDAKDELPEEEEAEFLITLIANYAKIASYNQAIDMYSDRLEAGPELKPCLNPSQTIKVLNGLSEIEILQGKYANAQSHLDQAIDIAQKNEIANADTLMIVLLRANMDWARVRVNESEKLYTDAMPLAIKLGEDGKFGMGEALDGLAQINLYKCKFKEAAEQAQQSYAIRKELFGEESLEVASSLRTFAKIESRNNPNKAQQLRLKALAIQIKLLGTSTHPTVANTICSLVSPPFDKSYAEGEHLCLSARHAVDGVLPKDSPFAASCMHTLAQVFLDEYRLKPAQEMFRQAIDLKSRLYGQDSMPVADSLRDLAVAQTLDTIERTDALKKTRIALCPEAESSINKAIQIADRQLGQGSVQSATFCATLAWIKSKEGAYKDAEPIVRKALTTLEQTYGNDDSYVRSVRYSLLRIYKQEGKIEDAKALLTVMLKTQINLNGLTGIEISTLLCELVDIDAREMEVTHQPSKNSGLYNQVKLLAIQNLPEEDSGIAPLVSLLKAQLEGDSNVQERHTKIAVINERLATAERLCGDNSPLLTFPLISLAEEYASSKDAREAYKRAISIAENGMGADHPYLISILDAYAKFLRDIGQTKEADQVSARSAAISKAEGRMPAAE